MTTPNVDVWMAIIKWVNIETLCRMSDVSELKPLAVAEFQRKFTQLWLDDPFDPELLCCVMDKFGIFITEIHFGRSIKLQANALREIDKKCTGLQRLTYRGITYRGFRTLRNIIG